MARRRQAARVYLGDPGPVKPEKYGRDIQVPDDDFLSKMSTSELLRLGIEAGLDPMKLLGINHCWEHPLSVWVQLNDRPVRKGFQYSVDIVYCNNCWNWFKARKPEPEEAL